MVVCLGNKCLDSILEELNRHKSVVVIHPNKPSSIPTDVVEGLPLPMMEVFFDTTRAVANMILKGTMKRFADIKFIIPHAQAFLVILVDRIAPALQIMPSCTILKDALDKKERYYVKEKNLGKH